MGKININGESFDFDGAVKRETHSAIYTAVRDYFAFGEGQSTIRKAIKDRLSIATKEE